MSRLPAIREEFIVVNDLENGLELIGKFGQPRLSRFKDGSWHCCVDMFVVGAGVEFKVASDFKQKNPKDAVSQCLARIYDTLKEMGL